MTLFSSHLTISLAGVIALAVACSCGGTGSESGPSPAEPTAPAPKSEPVRPPPGEAAVIEKGPDEGGRDLPVRLECLVRTYSEFIAQVDRSDSEMGPVVVMKDGLRLPWDDGVRKSFDKKLSAADLEDQLSIPYPVGEPTGVPAVDDDPGRIRVGAFFESVYGSSAEEVKEGLVDVKWIPGRGGANVRFSSTNGAAKALARVSARLAQLPPRMDRYTIPSSGTFNWRTIAGTNRRSAHSFGIAIDLNSRQSDYWRWALGRSATPVYHNRIPYEIVEVFEDNGFAWGGKWYHYDTMHFEYRPELFAEGCTR